MLACLKASMGWDFISRHDFSQVKDDDSGPLPFLPLQNTE